MVLGQPSPSGRVCPGERQRIRYACPGVPPPRFNASIRSPDRLAPKFTLRQPLLRTSIMKPQPSLIAIALVILPLSIRAHPEPEPHPTMTEFQSLASEVSALRASTRDLDQRITANIVRLDDQLRETAADVAAALATAAEQPLSVADQSSTGDGTSAISELRNLIYALAAAGGVLMTGLDRLACSRPCRRQSGSGSPAPAIPEGNTEPQDRAPDGESDQPLEPRIVTHTKKDYSKRKTNPPTLELHNPGQPWSPRAVQDAVQDIRFKGIKYVSRGPQRQPSRDRSKEQDGQVVSPYQIRRTRRQQPRRVARPVLKQAATRPSPPVPVMSSHQR